MVVERHTPGNLLIRMVRQRLSELRRTRMVAMHRYFMREIEYARRKIAIEHFVGHDFATFSQESRERMTIRLSPFLSEYELRQRVAEDFKSFIFQRTKKQNSDGFMRRWVLSVRIRDMLYKQLLEEKEKANRYFPPTCIPRPIKQETLQRAINIRKEKKRPKNREVRSNLQKRQFYGFTRK